MNFVVDSQNQFRAETERFISDKIDKNIKQGFAELLRQVERKTSISRMLETSTRAQGLPAGGHFGSRQPENQPIIQNRFRNDPEVSPGPSGQRQQIGLSNYHQNIQQESMHLRSGSSFSGSNQPRGTEGRQGAVRRNPEGYGYSQRGHCDPVHKWGIQFSGNSDGMSAEEFISRVEHLGQHYGRPLFRIFHRLVVDSAAEWY